MYLVGVCAKVVQVARGTTTGSPDFHFSVLVQVWMWLRLGFGLVLGNRNVDVGVGGLGGWGIHSTTVD